MEKTLELYGNLLLVFVGFITPLSASIFSIFYDGIQSLREQYENEKSQTASNIKAQLAKIGNQENQNEDGLISDVQGNLEKLREIEKKSLHKLNLLNPKKQILKLVALFGFSLIFLMLSLILSNKEIKISQLTFTYSNGLLWISILLFLLGIELFWRILGTIFEVSQNISKKQSEKHNEEYSSIVMLLQTIKKGSLLENVYVSVNGETVGKNDTKTIKLKLEEKVLLPISIINSEKLMAKNIEVGFILPQEFIIEPKSGYTIYKDKTSQIVRYSDSMLQANTNWIKKSLDLTPLKAGTFDIKVFFKGENVLTRSEIFKLLVE